MDLDSNETAVSVGDWTDTTLVPLDMPGVSILHGGAMGPVPATIPTHAPWLAEHTAPVGTTGFDSQSYVAGLYNGAMINARINASNSNPLSDRATRRPQLGGAAPEGRVRKQRHASMPDSARSTAAGSTLTRAQEREELNNGTLMFRKPLQMATVVVRGAEFHIHSDLLCRHSDYFKGALRGSFAEAATQRIELDDEDVKSEDFGLWVDLLYRQHFHQPGKFLLRKEETGGSLSTQQILTLWRLSDRFLNKTMSAVAEESLQHRLSLYSEDQWRKLYKTRPMADIRSRVSRLQDAYRQCTEQGLPFVDEVVAACANCPGQVYGECVDLLDADFMAQVSRRMILAHADKNLKSKEERQAALTESAAWHT